MNFFVVSALLASLFFLPACATEQRGQEPLRVVADTNLQTNLVFGPSAPLQDEHWKIYAGNSSFFRNAAPSRVSGGESYEIQFLDPSTHKPIARSIETLRLIAFSKSGRGKVLVHNLTTTPELSASALQPLKAMLGNGQSVLANSGSSTKIQKINAVLEDFGDEDATLVVQIFSPTTENPKIMVNVLRHWTTPVTVGEPTRQHVGGVYCFSQNMSCVGDSTRADSAEQCPSGTSSFNYWDDAADCTPM